MEARLMYLFLVSQSDLDQAGVIPLRFRKWSGLLGIPVKEVEELCAELDQARFTVTDFDTEELLVRSLIRRDEVWKQPNVFKAAATAATACESAPIKAALLAEVQRLDLAEANGDQQRTRADLLRALEPFGNPSPTPPRPSREPSAGRSLAVVSEPEPGEPVDTGNAAVQKGSRRVPEGSANGTDELRGKGKGIPVPLTTAFSPEPTPTPPSPPAQTATGPIADGVAEAKAGEGANSRERTPEAVTALVDEIRGIRRDWSIRSIRRALDDPDVIDRPWAVICVAFPIVACDPQSRHAGRLAADGDWWPTAMRKLGLNPVTETPADARPDWCGDCDERTRFLLDEFGQPGHLKCPACNPGTQRARSA
jgi:hypothetical protein